MRLYLLCGLPFSGKSTLARRLSEHLGCGVVSFDAINRERGLGFAGEREIAAAEWAETYGLAQELVVEALQSGCDVILDDVMGSARARRDFRELAARCGAKTCLIYIELASDELRRRRQANLVSQERPDVRPDILERVVEIFEAPSAAEGAHVCRADDRWDDCLAHLGCGQGDRNEDYTTRAATDEVVEAMRDAAR